MFIGHFAVGLAAKRVAPRLSLAVLFAAAQLADILWPIFVAAGIEQVRIDPGNTAMTPLDFISYPYSHSLVFLLLCGLMSGIAFRIFVYRDRRTIPILVALVLSHWILDWITHRPDMPLYPGSEKFGLGLWNSVPGTLALELVLFGAGVATYVRATRPRDGIGKWSLLALVAALVVIYVANLLSGAPPSVTAIWVAGLLGVAVLLAWSAWTDRHRITQAP
jgi:hypothetical protein